MSYGRRHTGSGVGDLLGLRAETRSSSKLLVLSYSILFLSTLELLAFLSSRLRRSPPNTGYGGSSYDFFLLAYLPSPIATDSVPANHI